jgi:hypothetical protein
MKTVLTILAAVMLFGAPQAAHAADVSAAVAALKAVESNQAKLNEFCSIQSELEAAGEDEAKGDAALDKLDAFFASLGDNFVAVMQASEEYAPDSNEAQALDAAFDSLDEKCS